MAEQGNQNNYDDGGMNILDYWRLICKRWKFIAALFLISILVSLLYSLTLPKYYRSRATILAPLEGGSAGGNNISISLGGVGKGEGFNLLGSAGSSMLSLSVPTPTRDTYLAILTSRTMREEVVEHFKTSWGASVGSLIGEVRVNGKEKGTISVAVESQDPKLSAAIANFYFMNITDTLAGREKNSARLQSQYYEHNLEQARRVSMAR